jgi:hypothetical protein
MLLSPAQPGEHWIFLGNLTEIGNRGRFIRRGTLHCAAVDQQAQQCGRAPKRTDIVMNPDHAMTSAIALWVPTVIANSGTVDTQLRTR